MSLGIQVSISKMREWERFLENTDSESDAPFRPRMPLMANPRALGECIRKANALSLPTLRNLLTCSGMASQKGALQSGCHGGTAGFAVACPFCGTQEKFAPRENAPELHGVKAQRAAVRQSYVRFRVCEFSVGE